ncbi:oligosaccharide flippase family protein [Spirochaeta isovalerica]|uniref:O-antigen/teichoic acid export membrane protein n=1 Tax=Spirochaeta isovalerica TaxID=150 RepID=A0A841R5X6_9SPIO|nr:oligosaccharide flippase family protein [Spirochaeta isovalerica]MBB6479255.1 O-antigen/teichoic acid export membrane protein [Spirochaeta isovalerica]
MKITTKFYRSLNKENLKKLSFKQKAIESASFIIFGYGISQGIRLFGNIILTRLLVPELFGLITLARVFILGLNLFTDIGIGPAIIRSKRSAQSIFLNSAWTLQIIRSSILALFSLLVAYPISLLYKQPILIFLIPFIGFTGLINGFKSTSLFILNKELEQKKIVYIEVVIQLISLIFTISIAYYFRNIFALLIGDVVSSIIRVFWSHILNKDTRNRFQLEKSSVKEIFSFGKWILIATAMTFLAGQTDRILLGKLFSMTILGVYTIAINFAEIPKEIISKLSSNVIYPLIAKYLDNSREELRIKIRNQRGKFLLIIAFLIGIFSSFSDYIIYFLYDERYYKAAWILPLLTIGMWPFILTTSIDGSLFAIGKPKYHALANFIKFIYMLIALPISFRFGGFFGAIIAIVINDIPSYIVINYGLAKEKLSLISQDTIITFVLIIFTLLLLLLRSFIGLGMPGMNYI